MFSDNTSILYLACIFVFIFFALTLNIGLGKDEILIMNDHYLFPFQNQDLSIFSSFSFDELGKSIAIENSNHFIDKIYYKTVNIVTSDFILIQRIQILVSILVLLLLPLYGFIRLDELFNSSNENKLNIFVATTFYTFNPLTTVFIDSGIFLGITESLSYSIIPLTFYYFYTYFYKENKTAILFKLSIALFLLLLSMYIFFIFAFLSSIFLFYSFAIGLTSINKFVIKLIKLTLAFLPLAIFSLPVLMQISININSMDSNAIQNGGTWGSMDGGLLYQILMYHFWTIYNIWEGRSILSFNSHFYSYIYIASVLSFYILIAKSVLSNKSVYIIAFLVILLASLFLGKGAQAPFGSAYLYILDNFPLGAIIRTPDNKFAISTIFALSMMLLLARNKTTTNSIIIILIIVISLPMFKLTPFFGINSVNSTDKAVKISKEYYELVDFLNSQKSDNNYILTIPQENGVQKQTIGVNNDYVIGPLILESFLSQHILQTGINSATNRISYKKIKNLVAGHDFSGFEDLPIGYILLNKHDVTKEYFQLIKYLDIYKEKIFENKLFIVYKNDNGVNIIDDKFNKISQIAPIYHSNNSNKLVNLRLNNNPFWKIKKIDNGILQERKFDTLLDTLYFIYVLISTKDNKNLMKLDGGAYNSWLTPDNGDYIMYYELDILSYIAMFFSFIIFIIYAIIILFFNNSFYNRRVKS